MNKLSEGPFLIVCEFLSLQELARCLQVSMRWHELLDTREHLWCHQCVTAWKRFIYVVPSLIQLSKGKKIYKDEILAARSNVARLSVKMLKQTLRDERIQVNPGMLLEKNDFVEAIVEGRKQKILLYNEDDQNRIFNCRKYCLFCLLWCEYYKYSYF